MPTVQFVPESDTDTAKVKLSKEGLVVDPRVMLVGLSIPSYRRYSGMRFECNIQGETLTVRRIEQDTALPLSRGWDVDLFFRIYDPLIENVPNFHSNTYTYHGLKNERAPTNDYIEEVLVDPAVTMIREEAFEHCHMKRCIMLGNNVTSIQYRAFHGCNHLTYVRLPSTSLFFIDQEAFWKCSSLECISIPESVIEIQSRAFAGCTKLKILILPKHIEVRNMGRGIVYDCPALLTDELVQYHREDRSGVHYEIQPNLGHGMLGIVQRGLKRVGAALITQSCRIHVPPSMTEPNPDCQVHQWLLHQSYNRLPIIRLCSNPDVTTFMIRAFIQEHSTAPFHQSHGSHGLLPLHIMTRYNANAEDDVILACFGANPHALFAVDEEGLTPLDYLRSQKSYNGNSRVDTIVDLISHCITTNLQYE